MIMYDVLLTVWMYPQEQQLFHLVKHSTISKKNNNMNE